MGRIEDYCEAYCEAEAFAVNKIEKNARAEKRERKLMDRKTHKKKSAHSGKKYTGFEYTNEEEELLRYYGF